MKKLRIIIAGGRDFEDYGALKMETLAAIKEVNMKINGTDKINQNEITIISGCARGADSLGIRFAEDFHLQLEKFPAQWDKYGNKAGYLRNQEMAKFASSSEDAYGVLIAFWDGKSKGTNHMINIAKKVKLEVMVIDY